MKNHTIITLLVAASAGCLFAFSSLISHGSAAQEPLPKEQILSRVDELKSLLGKKYWPTFDAPEYALELNYYEEGRLTCKHPWHNMT